MEFESFDMKPTQGEVNHADGQVPKPSVLDDLLGLSSTSMDVDPSSVNGETELNAYIASAAGGQGHRPSQVVEVSPARVPTLDPHGTQYLDVPSSSVSPERLFSSVRLVNSDLRGSLLDSTLIDVMWVKQTP